MLIYEHSRILARKSIHNSVHVYRFPYVGVGEGGADDTNRSASTVLFFLFVTGGCEEFQFLNQKFSVCFENKLFTLSNTVKKIVFYFKFEHELFSHGFPPRKQLQTVDVSIFSELQMLLNQYCKHSINVRRNFKGQLFISCCTKVFK